MEEMTVYRKRARISRDNWSEEQWDACLRQAKEYLAQVKASEGFEIGYFPKLGRSIIFPYPEACNDPIMIGLVKRVIKDYNRRNKTKYEFVKIKRVNSKVVMGSDYYITYWAKDAHGEKTFQTKVHHGVPKFSIEISRIEPTNNSEGTGKIETLLDSSNSTGDRGIMKAVAGDGDQSSNPQNKGELVADAICLARDGDGDVMMTMVGADVADQSSGRQDKGDASWKSKSNSVRKSLIPKLARELKRLQIE